MHEMGLVCTFYRGGRWTQALSRQCLDLQRGMALCSGRDGLIG